MRRRFAGCVTKEASDEIVDRDDASAKPTNHTNKDTLMNKQEIDTAIEEADVEIKKQHAALLKAQARLANAQAKEIEG